MTEAEYKKALERVDIINASKDSDAFREKQYLIEYKLVKYDLQNDICKDAVGIEPNSALFIFIQFSSRS